MIQDPPQDLIVALEALALEGSRPLAELGCPAADLQALGFEVSGGRVRLPAVERLDAEAIRRQLSGAAAAWLRRLDVLPVTASTSSVLQERARRADVDGQVVMAELQLGGRGRRGRRWITPFGASLAVSAGLHLPLQASQMGGFSLCVGIALVELLEACGVTGVSLKWPNDVLLDGRKLAGILVELSAAGNGVQVVVGIGMNLELPPAALATIDQPVTDLAAAGVSVSRNTLAAGLISGLVTYSAGFAEQGFEPMRSVFDARHAFHDRECTLLLGGTSVSGRVAGVGGSGELLLDSQGAIEAYSAGEVSLRAP